ncbi:flavin reductase [Nonomuraea sp. NPDC026600]|uniref:flavin reductase n=1 Tax=Nonomuraea sp. NPDC026600 TaxID=3155363 RepID=UPI0033C1EF73
MDDQTEAQRSFRTAMANLSAAVNVVTTDGRHGRAGVTVSAACSVTDAPPTMLVCVNRSSSSHDIVLANGRVCVNVLGTDQEELAMHFAGATNVPTAERFGEGSWDFDTHGVPVLRDALASVVGRIITRRTQGSHTVAFVEIDAVTARADSGALVYFQRRFHTLAAPAHSA